MNRDDHYAAYMRFLRARDAYLSRVTSPRVFGSDEERARIYRDRIIALEASLQHLDFDIIEFGIIFRTDQSLMFGTEALEITETLDGLKEDFPIHEAGTQVVLRRILNFMRLPAGQIGQAVLSYVDSLYDDGYNEDASTQAPSDDEEEDQE
jgi:hypothetical protein